MTEELAAFGTLLKRGNGATPEVFTSIAEVGDIDGPTLKAAMEDATNHGSTGGFEESLPTTLSMGQVKFPVNFIPTNTTHSYAAGLILDWKNKTKRNFQMVFPDGLSTTWAFSAYVEEVALKAPVKGILKADVTLTITGQPTLA
jgi:hypothetical protein